jgi:hypothetical protein
MLQDSSWFHQSVISAQILWLSAENSSQGPQKNQMDCHIVPNHNHVTILYVHYNTVACQRTFGHNMTKVQSALSSTWKHQHACV